MGTSVGVAAGTVVWSSCSSTVYPASVPVGHHLGAGGPGLPGDGPLDSWHIIWRLVACGQASHVHYLWCVQLIHKAFCHGYVAGFREVYWVSTEEFQQLVWFSLHRVHDSHQQRRVEDLCPFQPSGVCQVPQKLAQVADVVTQFSQVLLVPEVSDVAGVCAALIQQVAGEGPQQDDV